MEDTQRAPWMWDEVWAVLEAEVLCGGDLRAIEARLQPLLRRVGGVLLGALARRRLADLAGVIPACPGCGGRVRALGVRPRTLVGLVGEVTVRRPTYHCRSLPRPPRPPPRLPPPVSRPPANRGPRARTIGAAPPSATNSPPR